MSFFLLPLAVNKSVCLCCILSNVSHTKNEVNSVGYDYFPKHVVSQKFLDCVCLSAFYFFRCLLQQHIYIYIYIYWSNLDKLWNTFACSVIWNVLRAAKCEEQLTSQDSKSKNCRTKIRPSELHTMKEIELFMYFADWQQILFKLSLQTDSQFEFSCSVIVLFL
jgi:hypothetical protein